MADKKSDQNQVINERILLSVNPVSVMFGYIGCSIDRIHLWSDGSLQINGFAVIRSVPKMFFNILIPPHDVKEWMTCYSINNLAIVMRLKERSLYDTKKQLRLSDGFGGNASDYVVLLLEKAFNNENYKKFLKLLDANDVLIANITETQVKLRYELAKVGKKFENEFAFNHEFISNRSSTPWIPANMVDIRGSLCLRDNNKAFNNCLSALDCIGFQPIRVLFGTNECKIDCIEISLNKGISFEIIRKINDSTEENTQFNVEFKDIKSIELCESKPKSGFSLKLTQTATQAIVNQLGINEKASDGITFDANSGIETEQKIKVVFEENVECILLALTVISKLHEWIKCEMIESLDFFHSLEVKDIVFLRKNIMANNVSALMASRVSMLSRKGSN